MKALKQKNEDLEMRLKQVQAEKQDINEVSNEITLRITELQKTLDLLGEENGAVKTQVYMYWIIYKCINFDFRSTNSNRI